MSDIVELHLDNPVVAAGGRLSGSVRFTHPPSPKLEKVRAVKLTLRANVSGSGSPEQVLAFSKELAQGPQTGAPLPFEVKLPADAPISWDGRHVKVKWDVKVELDIPWASDPNDVIDFKVVPRKAR